AIVLHIAAFPDFSHITPHHPELCYPGVGWTATGREILQLKPDDGPPVTAEMITFEHQQRQGPIQVLFWYQVGDRTAVDYGGVRQAILKSRGKKTAPPLIKVLLQCPATDATNDKERLSSIAEPVFTEIKKATCPPASKGADEQ
ncbi:MAG TPA: exosortase-associated EpsI family protein, partial [Phycisphaerae bacterium]|nr:exosortase-associated EpsI family protein [Phycisphaerae bacterium]